VIIWLVTFTVGAMDGSVDMGESGTHSCAQREPLMLEKVSGVTATHTVDITNFKIISP